MDIRYRNDLYGNYMLITIPQGEDSNRYSFKMLEKNKIPGVLYGRERKEDGKGYWYVDISKKKTLNDINVIKEELNMCLDGESRDPYITNMKQAMSTAAFASDIIISS